MVLKYSFRIQKDLVGVTLNNRAYWEVDEIEIAAKMARRFDSSTEIDIMRTSFFQSFIDGMSTLYSNPFIRESTIPEELLDNYNYMCQENERNVHLSKESAVYFESNTKFVAIDASQYLVDDWNKEQIKVYLVNKLNNSILLFVENDGIYEQTNTTLQSISSQMASYRKTISNKWIRIGDLKALPFVFLRYDGLDSAVFNNLVTMQYNFIISMSWGFYNIDPKLLSQFVISSDAPSDQLKVLGGDIGRTTRALKVGTSDNIKQVETGDLKPLMDALTAYNTLIAQRALQYGVDRSLVDLTGGGSNQSADAKNIERQYINQKRRKYFRMFSEFEKDLIAQYNLVFGTNYVVKKVIFLDIPNVKTDAPVVNAAPIEKEGLKLNEIKQEQSPEDLMDDKKDIDDESNND